MIYVDNNEKLAELLTKLVSGKATELDKSDAKDLILDLERGSTVLTTPDKLKVKTWDGDL